MADETQAKRGGILPLIIIGLLVASLAVVGYLYYGSRTEVENKDFKIEDLNTEITDLETSLKDMETEIDRQDLELEEKDVLLQKKEKELSEKTKRIDALLSSNKITAKQAEEYKGKIDQLNFYIKKYQAEMDSLKAQVNMLTEENQQMAGKISNLEDQKFNVEQENRLNKTMLKAAAILKAYDFNFSRVKTTGKEDSDTEFRAGRLKDLKICFNLMENTVAKAGERDLYIVITDAKGKVIRDAGKSGAFSIDEKEMIFTLKTTVNYNRTTTQVCPVFHKPETMEFEKGAHKVTVYCEGYEIGTGNFMIK